MSSTIDVEVGPRLLQQGVPIEYIWFLFQPDYQLNAPFTRSPYSTTHGRPLVHYAVLISGHLAASCTVQRPTSGDPSAPPCQTPSLCTKVTNNNLKN